jgi:thiosulfate reductase cytochrome b subunit
MATYSGTVRRGLPRRPGGDPWPPVGEAPGVGVEGADAPAVEVPEVAASHVETPPIAAGVPGAGAREAASTRGAAVQPGRARRRGLPRVPGGEPWPPGGAAVATSATAAVAAPDPEPERAFGADGRPVDVTQMAGADAATPPIAPNEPVDVAAAGGPALRRGLPRVPGGEPWPPAGFVPATAGVPTDAAALTAATTEDAAGTAPEASAIMDYSTPLPFTRTVWPGAAARAPRRSSKPEPTRVGPFTRAQWAGAVVVVGGGLLYAGAMAVLAVRWLLSTAWGVELLAAFPGEYHLPEGAPVGFPAWLGWQHFFNVFLMVLIIRTGLQVRTEKRPTAFWSPRGNGRRKISLNLWFHQSLDILWLVNGAIFVVLLFVTGQWMRIVPTSWEVFPNAFSAALQYVSLDWPTENGWVNYNSLQQLAYFTTVFIAAPLAALTGVRMSGVWPKNATSLNRVYPVEWARAVHFPVMLYFVLFIFVHVVLVFATGALRNLNHMYAAQGSVDPNAYADNWAGFWIFTASIGVIVAAWIAARPLVLAPIARLFGSVSGR